MPEEYGDLGLIVPTADDYDPGQADVPRALREFADSLGEGVGAGRLLIAQDTGAAAFKAMKGEATLSEDGTLRLKPNAGLKQGAGGQVNLTEAFQDIAGTTLEITPAVPSYLRIWAVFGFVSISETTGIGTVNLDGADQGAPVAELGNANPRSSGTAPANYRLALTAAKHVIKLRAKKAGLAGTGLFDPALTHYLWDLAAS